MKGERVVNKVFRLYENKHVRGEILMRKVTIESYNRGIRRDSAVIGCSFIFLGALIRVIGNFVVFLAEFAMFLGEN